MSAGFAATGPYMSNHSNRPDGPLSTGTRSQKSATVKYRAPDKEPNIHLARKRYFEEKASLAREEHDDLRDVSDALIRPRIPSAKMVAARQRTPKADAKSSRIAYIEDLLAAEDIFTHTDFEPAPVQRSINYSQVERGAKVQVAMGKESASRAAVKKMIADKPGVAKALIDKRYEGCNRFIIFFSYYSLDSVSETARSNRYLGPQLQIPWGVRTCKVTHKRDEEDNSDDSVDDMLQAVRRARKRSQGSSSGEAHEDEDHFAHAYMTSTYALPKTAGVVMRRSSAKHVLAPGANFDFIGPQEPVDWARPQLVTSTCH